MEVEVRGVLGGALPVAGVVEAADAGLVAGVELDHHGRVLAEQLPHDLLALDVVLLELLAVQRVGGGHLERDGGGGNERLRCGELDREVRGVAGGMKEHRYCRRSSDRFRRVWTWIISH